jgi:hypothetical protein
MPTTNIPQILSSILTPDIFSRKDQRLRVMAYTLSLPLPKHINESTISKYSHISQSSISRTLSSNAISTQSITHSRIEYILQFLDSISLKPRYLILDETVIKRYGKKRIEKMGKFYSSIEKQTVNGVELLSSLLWVNSRLYFPLLNDMADVKSDDDTQFRDSIDKFITMIERINLSNLILLVDGGIMCARIFFQAKKKGYTLIGRIRKSINVIFNGCKVSLKKLSSQTSSITSVIAYIPQYRQNVKLVIDNRLSTKVEDKNGRIILSSDTSLSEDEILAHYSKRTYIELGFKYAKNELGLKSMVYSEKSMLRHVELVSLYFTLWMISQFWLNVKDRQGLRDFIEQWRIFYFTIF